MKHKSTGTLIRKLKEARGFESLCIENAEELAEADFCAYLEKLCREKRKEAGRVISASDIDRTYGYQIFNGTRRPSRDKAIQLAFGFGLDVEETQGNKEGRSNYFCHFQKNESDGNADFSDVTGNEYYRGVIYDGY